MLAHWSTCCEPKNFIVSILKASNLDLTKAFSKIAICCIQQNKSCPEGMQSCGAYSVQNFYCQYITLVRGFRIVTAEAIRNREQSIVQKILLEGGTTKHRKERRGAFVLTLILFLTLTQTLSLVVVIPESKLVPCRSIFVSFIEDPCGV